MRELYFLALFSGVIAILSALLGITEWWKWRKRL